MSDVLRAIFSMTENDKWRRKLRPSSGKMAIRRRLRGSARTEEEVNRVIAAYEITLRALGLADRTDRIAETPCQSPM
jgi:hypothetical protein